MARLLIIGGGCRGLRLAAAAVAEGHAARITTRTEDGRAAIEATGAECWIGTPDRLETLRGALDGATLACWLLARATGTTVQLHELHTSRLRFFLGQVIDTTVRGFIYESPATASTQPAIAEGEGIVREMSDRNAIPLVVMSADPAEANAWLAEARSAVVSLLQA